MAETRSPTTDYWMEKAVALELALAAAEAERDEARAEVQREFNRAWALESERDRLAAALRAKEAECALREEKATWLRQMRRALHPQQEPKA